MRCGGTVWSAASANWLKDRVVRRFSEPAPHPGGAPPPGNRPPPPPLLTGPLRSKRKKLDRSISTWARGSLECRGSGLLSSRATAPVDATGLYPE
jgi:hypothetical protein